MLVLFSNLGKDNNYYGITLENRYFKDIIFSYQNI